MPGKTQMMTFLSGNLHLGEEWKGRTIKKHAGQEGKKNAKHPLKYLFGANQHSVDSTEEQEWVKRYSLIGAFTEDKTVDRGRRCGFSVLSFKNTHETT